MSGSTGARGEPPTLAASLSLSSQSPKSNDAALKLGTAEVEEFNSKANSREFVFKTSYFLTGRVIEEHSTFDERVGAGVVAVAVIGVVTTVDERLMLGIEVSMEVTSGVDDVASVGTARDNEEGEEGEEEASREGETETSEEGSADTTKGTSSRERSFGDIESGGVAARGEAGGVAARGGEEGGVMSVVAEASVAIVLSICSDSNGVVSSGDAAVAVSDDVEVISGSGVANKPGEKGGESEEEGRVELAEIDDRVIEGGGDRAAEGRARGER